MKHDLITIAHNLLIRKFNLYIKIGIEIEFYSDKDLDLNTILFQKIIEEAKDNNIYINNLRKEKGVNQFEFDIDFDDPHVICNQITILKNMLIENHLNLSSKPYLDQPGSAMHFNISLHDQFNNNLYKKKDGYINDLLSYSIGGLLELANESMIFFAPNEESYMRFDNSFDVPKKICWGGNNRTTALRVLKNDLSNIRIEHRIPGADCNYYLSIISIIIAIYHGINCKIAAPAQIYGNSFDQNYNLLNLSKSYQESFNYYNKIGILKGYIETLII